jgi:uncharacterized protein (DUF302 family)
MSLGIRMPFRIMVYRDRHLEWYLERHLEIRMHLECHLK